MASGGVYHEYGAALRQRRIAVRMTQEQFAQQAGVTVSTVNRWEQGHAYPSRLAQERIAAIIGSVPVSVRAHVTEAPPSCTAALSTAEKIKRARRKLHWSQEKFAQAVHVTFSTVSRWENAHVEPSPLALAGIRAVLKRHGVELEG